MNNSPSVAVVILNWNGIDFLQKFLPALIEHTPADKARLIVADNGSTDGSPCFLNVLRPRIETIRLPENYGFAKGYNEALKQIEADYFVLLNSDVQVSENWLEPLINCMENNANIAACMPKIKSFDSPDLFEYAGASGGFIDRYGYPFCRGRILESVEEDKGQYDTETDVFWASGACMMVRADLYLSSGGLDSVFWAHMEEIDLCWRMQNTGYTIRCVPSSVVYHVGGGSLAADSPKKLYLNFRNNLFLLLKNLPKNKLIPVLFMRMVLDGVAAAMFLLKGQWQKFMAVPKAHVDFYTHLSYYLKVRKNLQKNIQPQKQDFMHKKSIVWAYYVQKIRRFSDLSTLCYLIYTFFLP